jgi:hypothetical protein
VRACTRRLEPSLITKGASVGGKWRLSKHSGRYNGLVARTRFAKHFRHVGNVQANQAL